MVFQEKSLKLVIFNIFSIINHFFEVNVNLAYNMKNQIMLQKQQDELICKKQRAMKYKIKYGAYPEYYNENSTEQQIKALEVLLDGIKQEFISGKTDKFCGIAFITFSTEDEKAECLKKHYKNFRQRLYYQFTDTFKKVLIKPDKSELFFTIKELWSLKLQNLLMFSGKICILVILNSILEELLQTLFLLCF